MTLGLDLSFTALSGVVCSEAAAPSPSPFCHVAIRLFSVLPGYEETLTRLASILTKHFADPRIVGTGDPRASYVSSSFDVLYFYLITLKLDRYQTNHTPHNALLLYLLLSKSPCLPFRYQRLSHAGSGQLCLLPTIPQGGGADPTGAVSDQLFITVDNLV